MTTSATIIKFPSLRAIPDDVLLASFNSDDWHDDHYCKVSGHGRYWHEDVFWELHRRGIAPPI